MVTISIQVDDAIYGKLQRFLNPDQEKKVNRKGMPPKEGW
jgi:hypothetical protein